jgi:hypothetical protein
MTRRFEREARDTAMLGSVHTIDVYDFGLTEEGDFYYVMELLDGLSLERFVQLFGPMEPARAVHVLSQVCHSLGEAHGLGFVHRDIKPANIFLCRLGPDYDFVKVLDFGLVKHLDAQADQLLTLAGTTAGTPEYMAPEVALGLAGADGRADLYSLGCVAYFLLTGRQVFAAGTAVATALAHINEQPVPPSARSEFSIPPELDAAIVACLAKEPTARPTSAVDLARGLAAAMPPDAWTPQAARDWWELHKLSFAEPPQESTDDEVRQKHSSPDRATLMLAGACVLTVALAMTLIVNAREAGPRAGAVHDAAQEPLGAEGGFELIVHDRYLTWIAILIVLLNVVNTTGQYILNRLIVAEAAARFGTAAAAIAPSRQFVTAFSGSITAAVNLVGLLVQLFLTARVLRWIGVRGALFVLPLIALANYSLIAVLPLLAVVRFGKILENSTDYSIQNTLRQALFLPTSREAKYKAKAAIDTFFTRVGDIVSAGVVAVGHAAALATSAFAGVNVVLTIIWLWIVQQIAREHRRRTV